MSCADPTLPYKSIDLIIHADWSINPKKRWMALAERKGDHHWFVHHPVSVPDAPRLFFNLRQDFSIPGAILAGFDFPIGLPLSYATQAEIENFLSALPLFGSGDWGNFYQPAENPSQISLFRPFYPKKPGFSKRQHLEQGLGIPFSNLYRLCEMRHENRRSACPQFWTLGSQQVGKAAIHGWKTLLAPAMLDHELNFSIWPFSGTLESLCKPGNIVVVETYPAEYYAQFGLFQAAKRMSKRRNADRKSCAANLLDWSDILHLELDESLFESINDGFGELPIGEDTFDALVGLYGMIAVVQGCHPSGEPVPEHISRIEGWIFGQVLHGNET